MTQPETYEDGFRRMTRVDAGTPILNKIPYINRLFSNSAFERNFIWEDPTFMVQNTAAAVSPDGKYLLVGKDNGGAVSIFNLLDPADRHIDLVPSRNDGQFKDLEVENGKISFNFDKTKPVGSVVAWLQFTPDASAFLVYRIVRQTNAPNTEIMELFDRATGQLLRTIPIEPKFKAGAVSPDGRFLLAAGASSLEYWDLTNGQKVGSVPLYGIGELSDLRCTPDGRFVLLVPTVGNVRVYDFTSITEVASLLVRDTRAMIDISPDGQVLAVVSPNLEIMSKVNVFWIAGRSADDADWVELYPFGLPSHCIQRYEIGTWTPLPEIKSVSDKKETRYIFNNVRFSRDGSRLVAIGESRHDGKKGIELRRGLFEFDLRFPDSDWRSVDGGDALPLHSDGKFLLDGRFGSEPRSEFSEHISTSLSIGIGFW